MGGKAALAQMLCSFWLQKLNETHFTANYAGPPTSLVVFTPLVDTPLADIPAVFFHISHWYLSWNTAGGDNCI